MREQARRVAGWLISLAVLAIAQRVVFLTIPAGQDEAGFFLIGQQWAHGDSLYGDFWVDRPPGLITIFALVGSIEWLRVVGCMAVVAVLWLVAATAYVWRGPRAAIAAGVVVATYAAAPMLGAVRVNGELLAAPFAALAMLCTALMLRPPATPAPARTATRTALLAAGAGAASVLAFSVKQSSIDGFIFCGVALAVVAVVERSYVRVLKLIGWAALGSFAATLVLLVWAASRGTGPIELFDAVVSFRAQAGEVIRVSSSGATQERLGIMILGWFASGLALLAVCALGLAVVARRDPIVVGTAATVVAVSGICLLGGSYWLHYLVQLVPASALAAGLLVDRITPTWRTRAGRGIIAGTVWLVAVAAVAWAVEVGDPLGEGPAEATGALLADSSEPGDTVVVAYGQPNVVFNSGLDTPYRHLWSLPIRTLDPDLSELGDLVTSSRRPTWIVQWGPSFDSWAIDATEFEGLVAAEYTEVAVVCDRTIWLRNDVDRTIEQPEEC